MLRHLLVGIFVASATKWLDSGVWSAAGFVAIGSLTLACMIEPTRND
jgi:hypothetical protein